MKIGIITMHKVKNFGSALQAYALQEGIRQFGCDSELIDYIYPKKVKNPITFIGILNLVVVFLCNLVLGFPKLRQKKKFEEFYANNFSLSPCEVDEISISELPSYDGYITGSDQVWNPRFAGRDTNFMLSFAPDNKPKISYASSFATTHVDKELEKLYAKYLCRYNSISVREDSGVKIIKELTGKDASVCCDPTLLLNSNEWDILARQSVFHIKYKYILIYPLAYMYNPYPKLYDVVSMVQNAFGCSAIYLEGRKEDAFRKNAKLIKNAGPADFVNLIKNAEFVITTSFHGAAFSMIYNKPMFGIVDNSNVNDSRIQSLMREFNAEKCLLDLRKLQYYDKNSLLMLKGDYTSGKKFIARSKAFLEKEIKQYFF